MNFNELIEPFILYDKERILKSLIKHADISPSQLDMVHLNDGLYLIGFLMQNI